MLWELEFLELLEDFFLQQVWSHAMYLAIINNGALIPTLLGLFRPLLVNTIGSFTGQAAGDFIDGKPFNSRAAIAGSIGGTAGSRIGDKLFGSGLGKKLFGPIACKYVPCMFITNNDCI